MSSNSNKRPCSSSIRKSSAKRQRLRPPHATQHFAPKGSSTLNPKLPPLANHQRVPAPCVPQIPRDPLLQTTGTCRSKESRHNHLRRVVAQRMRSFLRYAPNYQIPETLQHLNTIAHNNPNVATLKQQLNSWCDQQAPTILSRPFSAKIFDKDGKLVFCYLGVRWTDEQTPDPTHKLPITHLYDHSTVADWSMGLRQQKPWVADGFLMNDQLHVYHEATQQLASVLPPHLPTFDRRHHYQAGEEGDPRLMRYTSEEGHQVDEQRGVIHLVQGWIQQGQMRKGLYLSSDVTRTSTASMCMEPYYKLTRAVADTLATMYEVLFPEEYQKLKPAFDAAQWFLQDAGPWVGRALVYKLQVELHIDDRDVGPSVSFPCGSFTGGQMNIPQFKAKFSYWPGHICFFYSNSIFHRVAHWEPTAESADNTTTPGRIGSVFFFPEKTLEMVKDKPAGWAKNTGYGHMSKLVGP